MIEVPSVPGVAVGCDVVAVERVASLLERRSAAAAALFTATERADAIRDGVAPDHHVALARLAARFAVKEAVVKLLRQPPLAWTDVEVRVDADGAPSLAIHGRVVPIAVSMAHDGGMAVATVVATDAELATVLATVTAATAAAGSG